MSKRLTPEVFVLSTSVVTAERGRRPRAVNPPLVSRLRKKAAQEGGGRTSVWTTVTGCNMKVRASFVMPANSALLGFEEHKMKRRAAASGSDQGN